MESNNKIVIILFILFVIGSAIYLGNKEPIFQDGVACTADAKLCPDGSYVGRGGPQCEFTACPPVETYFDEGRGISFTYPKELPTTYISTLEWPPKVEVLNESVSCKQPVGNTTIQTEKREILGRDYCVTEVTEGAAGSIYRTYTYTFEKDGKLAAFNFTLQEVQCMNYDLAERELCENEILTFNLEHIISQMAESLKI